MPLKNPYTITPGEIRIGDSFDVVVICHLMSAHELRFYRAQYQPEQSSDGVPQGAYMGTQRDRLHLGNLFPTISNHLLG